MNLPLRSMVTVMLVSPHCVMTGLGSFHIVWTAAARRASTRRFSASAASLSCACTGMLASEVVHGIGCVTVNLQCVSLYGRDVPFRSAVLAGALLRQCTIYEKETL